MVTVSFWDLKRDLSIECKAIGAEFATLNRYYFRGNIDIVATWIAQCPLSYNYYRASYGRPARMNYAVKQVFSRSRTHAIAMIRMFYFFLVVSGVPQC